MIEIKVKPKPVDIKKTALGQHSSFDFLLQNASDLELLIQEVKISVFDADGNLAWRRAANTNGIRPGIETPGNRTLETEPQPCVFNPLHTLPADLPCEQLDHEFHLGAERGQTFKLRVAVSQEVYDTGTDLCLPIGGRPIALDGHDFCPHHRRVDLMHPFLAQYMGF